MIENDLSLLKSFPNLHKRTKLLTFNINTRLNYFVLTTPPEISSVTTERLETSVDEFLAHTLHFPTDYKTNQNASSYTNALQQIQLGILDRGCGCDNNKYLKTKPPFIDVFYHQSSEQHPGHTARAPPITRGGRVRTGNQTTASPMP
jgi:hypothetical protein